MIIVRFFLILTAALATMNAIISFFAQLQTDCYIEVLVAICALGGWFLVDYLESEHNARITQCRRDVWARRDEAGL